MSLGTTFAMSHASESIDQHTYRSSRPSFRCPSCRNVPPLVIFPRRLLRWSRVLALSEREGGAGSGGGRGQDSAAFAHHLAVPARLVVCPLVHVNFARGPRHLALSVFVVVFAQAHVDFAVGKRLRTVPVGPAILNLAHEDARCEVPRHSLVRLLRASFVRVNRRGQWSRQPLDLVQKKETEEARMK